MDSSMITFRSVTPAQRGENLLRKEGIACTLRRTPRELAEQGCGYSIRMNGAQLSQAAELLRKHGISYRKVYRLRNGVPEEVIL